jgi:hypothetical protein
MVATWILFAGLLVAIYKVAGTTWVSLATCLIFTGWSIILRLVERCNIIPANSNGAYTTSPDGRDAMFIMGRSNAAFVLQGSRKDVKDWTSRGLTYRERPWEIPASLWQAFTHVGSLLVLLFIFSAIPNGSTVDQVAFILLNTVAQLNVLIGQRLNSQYILSKLLKVEDTKEVTRTHVYAKLIRRFRKAEETHHWVKASNMLPRTEVWDVWKAQVGEDTQEDPKTLYQTVSEDLQSASRSSV